MANIKDIKKAYTHAGVFHADDVFSAAMLRVLNPEIVIKRVLKVPEDTGGAIIFDIGRGKYDHHQDDSEMRLSGIPYAAFGLLWRDFGVEVCKALGCAEHAETVAAAIDKSLAEGIDAYDNGIKPTGDCSYQTVSSLISNFNPSWDETESMDERFEEAVEFAEGVLQREVKRSLSCVKARSEVAECVQTQDGPVITLDRFLPWQGELLRQDQEKRVLYIVFPSIRGGYNVRAVPESPGSSENRKSLPVEWRGLETAELERVTGVAGATFCHPAGFLAAAKTKDAAMKLARRATEV